MKYFLLFLACCAFSNCLHAQLSGNNADPTYGNVTPTATTQNTNGSTTALNSFMFINSQSYGGAQIAYIPTGGVGNIGGVLSFATKNTFNSYWTEGLRMVNGNVGIGTSNLSALNNRLVVAGGGVQINMTPGSNTNTDASLQINGSTGCCDRLTQLSPVGANKQALNIIADIDANNNARWYSWGVGSGVYQINSGLSFNGSGLNINGAGNVGIGITNPNSKLQINNSPGTNGLNVLGNDSWIGFSDNNNYLGGQTTFRAISGGVANALISGTNGNSYFSGQGGNVGVGTINPGAKLEVLVANLGATAGNYQPLTRLTGSGPGNAFMVNDFVYRENAGSDWYSESYIRGISVDNSFLVPGTTLKSWIKQKPNGDRIEFGSNAGAYMSVVAGNVGIGAANPLTKLQVNAGVDRNLLIRSGADLVSVAGMAIQSVNDANSVNLPLDIESSVLLLNVGTGGSVGIGTTAPGNFKLAVNGDAIFKRVQVKTSTPWPDYVFSAGYELPSLSSLETYINQNKHLPDLPSAEEVEKEGHDLGATQAGLLKKIEELTLYVIEQGKKNNKLESQNELLHQRIERLEKERNN